MRLVQNSAVNQLLNELLDLGWEYEFKAKHLILRDPSAGNVDRSSYVTMSRGAAKVSYNELRQLKVRVKRAKARAAEKFQIGPSQIAVQLPDNATVAMKKQLKTLQRSGLILRGK